MDYASLGDSGVMVSRLALGLGFRGQPDEQEMERAIRRAIELGINFLDCANVYGRMDDRHSAGQPAHRPLWAPALMHRCALHSATPDGDRPRRAHGAAHNQGAN